MKTNKILAVALSAGLVLGGASYAHAGGSASVPNVEEKQPADLDKAIKDAEAELKKAEGELAEAKDELAELWAEGANAGSDDDTNPLAAEFEAKSKEVENLEIKVAEAKTKLDKAKAEKGKKELEDAAKKEAEEEAYREKLNQAKADAIYELKNAGITSDLLLKQIEKAKTIEGVEALKNEILKSHEASKPNDDKKEDDKKEDNTKTIDDYLIDKNSEGGYISREQAEIAAKAYLKKHPEFNSFRIVEGRENNFYFVPEINDDVEDEKPDEKPGSGLTTLDDWQIAQNEKDGYFTEEDAKRAGELALEKAGLKGLYKVEVRKNAVGNMWFWRFVPVEAAEEEKPGESIPWTPLTPANPINPSTPWTPLTPADPIVPGRTDDPILGGDDKVVLPEEKPEDNKETEIKEENPKEGEEKEEKAKPSKDKEEAKPAKQKGNNPKTGLVGLAPIYSTLAISMAGIVAARKKND